jgi:hypothetical protein
LSFLHLPWRNTAVKNEAAAEIIDRVLLQATRQTDSSGYGPLYGTLTNIATAINGRGFETIFAGLIPTKDAEEIVAKHRFWDAISSGRATSGMRSWRSGRPTPSSRPTSTWVRRGMKLGTRF